MTATTCQSDQIGIRMKAAREALGLTQEGLAQAVGGSKRGIQNNEALKSVPGGEVICGLVRLGINANWLLTGEGEMLLKDQPSGPRLAYSAPATAIDYDLLAEVIAALENALDERNAMLPPDKKAEALALLYEEALAAGEDHENRVRRVLRLVNALA